MNRKNRIRGVVRRFAASGLVILLTLALTTPAWAVVFTNPAAITLNDAPAQGTGNPYPANISVSGMMGNITKVTVTLQNLNHTFPDDLDILLVGPTGVNVPILSDAGGSENVTNVTLTFDDDATVGITDAGQLQSGTFDVSLFVAGDVYPAPAPAPSANTMLSAFNGTNPNGMWSLFIVDDTGVDQGSIGNGWSLTITTDMTSATAFTSGSPIFLNDRFAKASLYPSPITVSGLTGAITDINVTLTGLSHLNPDDLDIVLVGPTGKRFYIMSDAGGTPDLVNVNITLDDEAATDLPDSTVIATGSFRPRNYGTGDTMQDLLPPIPSAGSGATATLGSVFDGTDPNGTWSLYIVDDATGSAGTIAGGWSVDITAGGTFGAKRFTSSDFDGDGLTDVSVHRGSDRTWYYRESTTYSNRAYIGFGEPSPTDTLVPGDYDGDDTTDFAVFRANGVWYVIHSTTNTLVQTLWGTNGDVPVPADYDGDGAIDIAVWRAGVWYVLQSSTNTGRVVSWGAAGDVPVRGHFEGTDGADFTVFRPAEGNWYILNNAATTSRTVTWGAAGDELVPADYDGDGETDVAIFRPSNGTWYIIPSITGTAYSLRWGAMDDVPVPGDYDGDSKADIAIWRPSVGSWFIINSGTIINPAAAVSFTNAAVRFDDWGIDTDVPLPSTYLP